MARNSLLLLLVISLVGLSCAPAAVPSELASAPAASAPASLPASLPARKATSQAASQAASLPTAQPSEPAIAPVATAPASASQPGSLTAKKATSQAASLPTSQPASRPASAPAKALTAAQEAELMAFLRQTDPVLVRQLEEMRKRAPGPAESALHRLWHIYQTVRDYPPEVRTAALSRHRINVQVFRTLRELRQCKNDTTKAELMTRLRDLLNQLFDSEQIVRDYEIQRLAGQLDQLKKDVDERRQHRHEHVQSQLDQLIRRAATQPSLNVVEETLK